MTPEDILKEWFSIDTYADETGREGTDREEYLLSDEDFLDLIHRAQREAVEKAWKYLRSNAYNKAPTQCDFERTIYRDEFFQALTPEKILGGKG